MFSGTLGNLVLKLRLKVHLLIILQRIGDFLFKTERFFLKLTPDRVINPELVSHVFMVLLIPLYQDTSCPHLCKIIIQVLLTLQLRTQTTQCLDCSCEIDLELDSLSVYYASVLWEQGTSVFIAFFFLNHLNQNRLYV